MVMTEKQLHEGYKITEFGKIPVEWDVFKLEDILDVRDGTHESPKYVGDGIPFVTSKNLKNGRIDFQEINYITKEDHISFSKRSYVENGDILFGMIGTVGNPVIVNTDFEFSIKNVALIKFANSKMHNKYVLEMLNSPIIDNQFRKKSNGGVQKFISLGVIRKLDIIAPPLKEQQKIAEILSTVDEQIKNTDQLIEKTNELKKGLMQQLLTKGIGHTKFKQTELGEIPIEWEIYKMEDICERIIVGIASSTSEYYTNEENSVPIIRNQNIKENKIEAKDLLYITKEFDIQNKKKRLRKGDLITVRTGYPGITAVVTSGFVDCQSFTTLISSPYHDKVSSNYLAYYLNSPFGKNELEKISAGGAQQNLNVSSLSKFLVKLPNIKEQQKIAEILSTVDEQIESYEQEKEKYLELKKGLMQQLLTGKLRVTV